MTKRIAVVCSDCQTTVLGYINHAGELRMCEHYACRNDHYGVCRGQSFETSFEISESVYRVMLMPNDELRQCWDGLRNYDPAAMWDSETTMDDWAQEVYSEMLCRGLKTT
jgi:hypothetical protein